MIPVKSNHPPGYIGVITGDLARYPSFYQSLLCLQVPEGTSWSIARGVGIADNRNRVVEQMKGDWLWFIDDDLLFDRYTLMRLLDAHVDVIVPIVPQRKPPFHVLAYHADGDRGFKHIAWDALPSSGRITCDACTAGGILVRRRVFDAVGKPWFREGETRPELLGEDLDFCSRAKVAGFEIWVDCNQSLEHISTSSIGVMKRNGKRIVTVRVEDAVLEIPSATS